MIDIMLNPEKRQYRLSDELMKLETDYGSATR